MLAKYINKYRVKRADKKEILKYDDIQVINPKDEDFICAGYKELIEEEVPSLDEETEYLSFYFEELKDKIKMHYKINKIEEEVIEDEENNKE